LRARLLCLLARVSFDAEISDRSGKPAAVNVRVDLIQAKARVVVLIATFARAAGLPRKIEVEGRH
jgi:hypothetical protein